MRCIDSPSPHLCHIYCLSNYIYTRYHCEAAQIGDPADPAPPASQLIHG